MNSHGSSRKWDVRPAKSKGLERRRHWHVARLLQSALPLFDDYGSWTLRLHYALESPDGGEALLSGAIGERAICFYDASYAFGKDTYDRDDSRAFHVALLADAVEIVSGIERDWEEEARVFMSVPPSAGGEIDEIQGSTVIEEVSHMVFEGRRFQICEAVLSEDGDRTLRTLIFVPSTLPTESLRPGDQIVYRGWLCGLLVESEGQP